MKFGISICFWLFARSSKTEPHSGWDGPYAGGSLVPNVLDYSKRSTNRVPDTEPSFPANDSLVRVLVGSNNLESNGLMCYNTIQYNKISSAQSIWSKTDCALHCPVRWE